MRPKLQKQSALKLAGRIIPRSKLSGAILNTPQLALKFIPVIFAAYIISAKNSFMI